MAVWWILRLPVFLAILVRVAPGAAGGSHSGAPGGGADPPGPSPQINFCIFIRILHTLMAKLRARQMRYSDYKCR